jgi:uncharacterized secreted repeat protein (TIGR03808 family)
LDKAHAEVARAMALSLFTRRSFLASVTAFGATAAYGQELLRPKGDGDHTAMLRKALTRGPVLLGPGVFNVSGLVLPPHAYLRGVRGQTTFVATTGPALLVEGAEGVTVEDITLSSPGAAFELFGARDAKNLLVRGCVFANGARAVALERCAGRIEGCDFAGQGSGALFSIDGEGLLISGNLIEDCANNGIQVWRSESGEDGTIISNNRVTRIAAKDGGSGQNGNGISIFRAGNVIVSGNRVTDCAFSAIRSNSGSGVQIVGNTAARCEETAIYSEFAYQGAIIANNSVEDSAFGISIANYDVDGRLAVCQGNVIRNLRQGTGNPEAQIGGIHCEADTLVSSNVIEGARDYGIRLGWGKCRNLAAAGNIIRKTRHGIEASAAQGAETVTVTSNTIAADIGIIAMDHHLPASGDLLRDASAAPPHMLLQQNRVGA